MERVICHVEDLPPLKQMDPFTLVSLVGGLAFAPPTLSSTIDNVLMFVRDEGDISCEERPNDLASRLSRIANSRLRPKDEAVCAAGPISTILRRHRPLPWG